MAETSRNVTVSELTVGMVIEEVTELSFDYASLDEDSLKFLKTAFKGAQVVLMGEDGARTVPVSELKQFDPVQAITGIPAGLKAATVVQGLSEFLENHGLLAFRVVEGTAGSGAASSQPPKSKSDQLQPGSEAAKRRFEDKKEDVKKFMETVQNASEDRTKASNAVEDMLDQGRGGSFNAKGVEAVVDDLLSAGSASAMKAIAGLRGSDQTYAHCTDMSVILQDAYAGILQKSGKQPSEANRRFALISGFMHDIGKSEVPKDILDSTTRFAPDSKEMLIMRNHTVYGARILSDMSMPAVTINVAHYHHVKIDTDLLTSYPAADISHVLPLTRLASICDVYQALIGRRRYKKNWVPGKAVEYLLKLKGSEFDDQMLDFFVEAMGRYPVGSLLRLSTGDLAYVLELAPRAFPERPIVAVVENAKGDLLTSHSMLDLMVDTDINVVEVVDHYVHYNESDEQAYQIFSSIKVA